MTPTNLQERVEGRWELTEPGWGDKRPEHMNLGWGTAEKEVSTPGGPPERLAL